MQASEAYRGRAYLYNNQGVRRSYSNDDVQKVILPVRMKIFYKSVISANLYSLQNDKGCFTELKTSDGEGSSYSAIYDFWFSQYKDGTIIHVGEYYALAIGISD